MKEEIRGVRGDYNLPPSLAKRNRYTKSLSYNGNQALINQAILNKLTKGNIYVSDSTPTLLSALSEKSTRIKSQIQDDDRSVTFNELVKVVLIPSRQEYKSRGLENDLWWNNSDYFQFQQEARSEITLCATYENITFSQARTRLYQPDPEESDPYNSKLTISQSISQMSLTQYDDEDYFSTRDSIPTKKSLKNDESDENSDDDNDDDGRILFYQHSPKPSMTNMLPASPKKSNTSITKQVSYTSLGLEEVDGNISDLNSLVVEPLDDKTNSKDIILKAMVKNSNADHDDLNVCVLSPEFQELTTSSSYPDTYLERLRKRNMVNLIGGLNTPSITVCSVFALTLVAVVARFF